MPNPQPLPAATFALVFLQLILGLHGRRIQRLIDGPPLLPVHRSLGLAALAFAFLHPVLFAWARVLRTGQSAVVDLHHVLLAALAAEMEPQR